MVEIAGYYNIPCVNLEFPTTGLPDLEVVKQTLEADKDIAVVATVHHETGTGVLNPVRKIYGLIPVNIEDENIDFCMSSAQKGLCGMTGVSWTVGKIEEIEKTKDYPKRSYYCNLFMQYDFLIFSCNTIFLSALEKCILPRRFKPFMP
jgi:2-aminoethylphosphonate-pyruvate transaminase